MGYFHDIQRAVRKIPRGKVATYGDVARAAGHPGTARQIAWALRDAGKTGIPWHRVLGSGGRILLPGEAGSLQRMLLDLEGAHFSGERVDLKRSGFRFALARKMRQRTQQPESKKSHRRDCGEKALNCT